MQIKVKFQSDNNNPTKYQRQLLSQENILLLSKEKQPRQKYNYG